MISDLPGEIIEEIFQYAEIKDLISVIPMVCKTWEGLSKTKRLFEKFQSEDEDRNMDYNIHGGIRKYFITKFDTKKWFKVVNDVFQNKVYNSPKVRCVGGFLGGRRGRGRYRTRQNNCVRVMENVEKKGEYSVYFSHRDAKEVRYNTFDEIFENSGHQEVVPFPDEDPNEKGRMEGVLRFDSYRYMLSCACGDGYVRIFDTKTKSFLPTKYGKFLEKESKKSMRWDYYVCTDCCFTDSGEKIFGSGILHDVKLFDIETSKICQEWRNYEEFEDVCTYRVLAPKNHSSFFVLGCSQNVIEFWSRKGKHQKPFSTLTIENGMYPHTSLSLINDHQLIICTQVGNYSNVKNEDGNIQCFDIRNLKSPVKQFGIFKGDNRGNIQSVFFDQYRGISVNIYGSCSLWSSTFSSLGTIDLPFGSGPTDVHFAHDGRVFAIAYQNPESGWMGTVGVVFDGRRKKNIVKKNEQVEHVEDNSKLSERNSDTSSKCVIQ